MSMGITKQFFITYDCLVKSDKHLTLNDIAALTGLNKSSIHRHIAKLQNAGVVSVVELYQFQYRISDNYEEKEIAQLLESSRPFFEK